MDYEITEIRPDQIDLPLAECVAASWADPQANAAVCTSGNIVEAKKPSTDGSLSPQTFLEGMQSIYCDVQCPILLIARSPDGQVLGHRFSVPTPAQEDDKVIATRVRGVVLFQRRSDREVLGFRTVDDSTSNLRSIWDHGGGVAPPFRRQGITRALLREQHRIAKHQGYELVSTGVAKPLKPMMILNLQEGFEVVDYVWVETDHYKTHVLLFAKRL